MSTEEWGTTWRTPRAKPQIKFGSISPMQGTSFPPFFQAPLFLGPPCGAYLALCGLVLLLQDCIEQVFKVIAVPYSPHRPEVVRESELQAKLRSCLSSCCTCEQARRELELRLVGWLCCETGMRSSCWSRSVVWTTCLYQRLLAEPCFLTALTSTVLLWA